MFDLDMTRHNPVAVVDRGDLLHDEHYGEYIWVMSDPEYPDENYPAAAINVDGRWVVFADYYECLGAYLQTLFWLPDWWTCA